MSTPVNPDELERSSGTQSPTGTSADGHAEPAPTSAAQADGGKPAGPSDEHHDAHHEPAKRPTKALIAVGVFLLLLLILGLAPRLHNTAAQQDTAADNQTLVAVDVMHPQPLPKVDVLTLPGTIEALKQTSLSARTTGYVSKILVDIGESVKAGQVLAVIETPDVETTLEQSQETLVASQASLSQSKASLLANIGTLNQQRASLLALENTLSMQQANLEHARDAVTQAQSAQTQAQAQVLGAQKALAQAQANLAQGQVVTNLAKVTMQRYQALLAQGAIDKETVDQDVAAYNADVRNGESLQAAVESAQANVESYQAALKSAQDNVLEAKDAVASAVDTVHTAQNDIQSGRAIVATAQANVAAGQANINTAAANVNANTYSVSHNAVEQGFSKVIAPFDGVVTARNVDVGDLVSSGSSSAGTSLGSGSAGVSLSGSAASGNTTLGSTSDSSSSSSGSAGGSSMGLFSIAQMNNLLIYVNVPQSNASQIHIGDPAQITVAELPGKTFQGTVYRTADALDPASRTLVTEIQVANPQGLMRPGQFASVAFQIPQAAGYLQLPDTALITGASGTQVAVVTKTNTIHFQNIDLVQDDGVNIEVSGGIGRRQEAIVTPTNSMIEGQTVKPTLVKPARGHKGAHGGAGGGAPGAAGGAPGATTATGTDQTAPGAPGAAGGHHHHHHGAAGGSATTPTDQMTAPGAQPSSTPPPPS